MKVNFDPYLWLAGEVFIFLHMQVLLHIRYHDQEIIKLSLDRV